MLSHRVAIGAVWLVGARLSTKFLDLIGMLIVARILTPADFGLFALASSVLLIVSAVSDLSLSDAIVQMQNPDDRIYDTAFTLGLARGLLLAAILCALALPFAHLYGDGRIAPILFSLAGVPILRGLSSPRMASLQRTLQFRPVFILETVGKFGAFTASVAISYLTQSYWALVAGIITTPLLWGVFSYRYAPYRPAFALVGWRQFVSFSGWLTLSNAVNTVNWQSDRFFIGGRLGTAVLGQYTVGSELASLPTNAPVLPVMQALYAGFAQMASDLPRLRTAYLTSQCVVMALALPIALSVAAFATPIIVFAIGPEWLQSATVVQILAPVFAVQLLTAPAHSIAMSTGQTKSIFRRDVLAFAIRLSAILAGLWAAGFIGLVWARVFSGSALVLLNLLLMQRILGISLLAQLLAPWRSFLSGALMTAFMIEGGRYFDVFNGTGLPNILLVGILAVLGFCVFYASHIALWAINKPVVSAERKLLDILRSRPHLSPGRP